LNLAQLLEELQRMPRTRANITAWKVLSARPGRYHPFPPFLPPVLRQALEKKGIDQLYSHQAEALQAAWDGKHVAVVTPAASGKTLCYNLPVLTTLLQDPEARALYLFPTKALAQDQLAELHDLVALVGSDIRTYTYDGDTPASARQAIRSAGHIVVTNPDMLHTGILPHHTKWLKLFSNLRFVVIDEMHQFRGVFGSHLANVIRRLKRICQFYGAHPRFILCSATIANPQELAQRLIEDEVVLVDQNGAPSGEKHFIFYNPPLVNRELGIRRSALLEGASWARLLLSHNIQTITFARTRLSVEVLLRYLRERTPHPEAVQGYRGGYLPLERRRIERGLREGHVRAVVSTNALELGIDIGQLEACVMVGYPGTVASTWQQAGRAGRRSGLSLAVLVASSNPLDQYIVNHPEYFFSQSPEYGLINPDNLYILMSHLKCAAFELPFAAGEQFAVPTTEEMLAFLQEEGVLHRQGDRYFWVADAFPAEGISLRSAAAENFVVVDQTGPSPRVIGEVDAFSAPMLLHEEAIYMHGGEQYQVEKLDYPNKKAYVRQVEVDYYTDASLAVEVKVLEEWRSHPAPAARGVGQVLVRALATMFKKIKLHTHENVGSGPIHLPEQELPTTAYWVSLAPEVSGQLPPAQLEAGLAGIAHLLAHVGPLFLLCDPRDLGSATHVRSPHTGLPTIYLYDAYPGGVGLAEKLYDLHEQLLEAALATLKECPCRDGCPSCVGPAAQTGQDARGTARLLLERALGRT